MNILIPDSWLRDYLKTKATPKQLKDCLSLCGPSVERINKVGDEIVYDIEVTGNRPDMMSITGIAREASVILPRFGIKAEFLNDPYTLRKPSFKSGQKYSLSITTDETLNPRFTAVVIDKVNNKPSPAWMQKLLTLSGMRPINSVVDITNYLMKENGQPVHAFDYDQIRPNKKGIPTMILRSSKKGEQIMTLDEKTHILPGDDIVIEDGTGRLIDLCGIMGGGVSHIKDTSTRIVLFVQTYDPSHIRKTSMALSHRTEAAALFEKGLDTELVMPTFLKGIKLIREYTGGIVSSKIYDVYPSPYKPHTVSVGRTKVNTYIGEVLTDKQVEQTLTPLGLPPMLTKDTTTVTVPSFRRDITIDVDVIEEIARIYGYHNIKTRLPNTEPPVVFEDPVLKQELLIKHTLKDWGFTETYTYSMISEDLMEIFDLDKDHAYRLTNPLSEEWVYMRPTLLPSMLLAVRHNLSFTKDLSLFELSMTYEYQKNDLPHERPTLIVARTGEHFLTLKGVAEAIFSMFVVPFSSKTVKLPPWYHPKRSVLMGSFGVLGEVHPQLLRTLSVPEPVTVLELDIEVLLSHAAPTGPYRPISKYPASFEDLSFVFPSRTPIGPVLEMVQGRDPLVAGVTLIDSYGDSRTMRITYQSNIRNLTSDDLSRVREKIIKAVQMKFSGTLKG